MKRNKIDKATAIKSILSDLKKGIDKKSIFGKIRKDSEIPKSTIYDWYKIAEKQYLEFKSKAAPIIEAREIETLSYIAENNIKDGILSKTQALKILSDLAMTAKKDTDKINAAKTIAEWEGWKSPLKTEINAQVETISKPLTPEEAKKFLDDLENNI